MVTNKKEKKFFEKQLSDFRDQVWGCARCNWCQNQWGWNVQSAEHSEVCPAFNEYRVFPYSGMGKMHIARALLEGDFDYEDAPELAEIVYSCTTCGACEMNCQRMQDKEPLKVTETLRAQLVKDGIGPMPEQKRLIKSVKNYANPWMQPRTQRDRWAKRLKIKNIYKEPSETLFFVGCTTALDPTLTKVAQNTAELLIKAGVDFGILGKEELCCGSPIARIGDRETFFSLAKENIDKLNKAGMNQIVTACPGCYRAIRHDYPEIPDMPEIKFKVFHIVEFVESLIKQGKITFRKQIPLRVTWHDPCHLGRHCGIYDAPRSILNAIPGIEFVEKERIKDQSWCCGGGGGVRTAFPDFAHSTAAKLIDEAKKTTGAEAIITCCPFCELNISDVLIKRSDDMKLIDLTELIISAM